MVSRRNASITGLPRGNSNLHLPAAFDGMTIAQLSDIHMSGYMRARKSAAPLTWPTILAPISPWSPETSSPARRSLEECIEEIRRLSAPLGIYGCNGNHEIYADAEDARRIYSLSRA